MSEAPPTPLELAEAENVVLKIKVSTLQSDVAARDRMIESLQRRRTPVERRDPKNASAFKRPFAG